MSAFIKKFKNYLLFRPKIASPSKPAALPICAEMTDSQRDDGIREKARRFYGYGRWTAPYWFIGPEEGGSDDPERRVEAWRQLGEAELCDCREFHSLIEITKHHRETPPLQYTWRKLMLLLKAFQGEPCDLEGNRRMLNDRLRSYQRDWWGMQSGKTCVIELSELPAPDSKKAKELRLQLFSPAKFDEIRQKRIEFIYHEMLKKERELVVIYGKEQWKHWESIAGHSLQEESIEGFAAGILKYGATKIAFAQHPNFVRKDAYWVKLGRKLREIS
jgi:hypothetical protein